MTKKAYKLIKERNHRCECCKNLSWLDKPIPLEIHHIDGNNKNNDKNNLQLLCPNCHALTPNYKGKNIKSIYPKTEILDSTIIEIIPKCTSISQVLKVVGLSSGIYNYERIRSIMANNNIKLKQKYRSDAQIEYNLSRRIVKRPSKEELEKLIWEKPAMQIAKDFGVSDKAIEKWCVFYGIKKPSRGYWQKNWCA